MRLIEGLKGAVSLVLEGFDAKETAKEIRQRLKKEFPGVKFSVRKSDSSLSSSVDIYWTDGPAVWRIEEIAKEYESVSRDEMGGILKGGNMYVSAHRTISDESNRKLEMLVMSKRKGVSAWRLKQENEAYRLSRTMDFRKTLFVKEVGGQLVGNDPKGNPLDTGRVKKETQAKNVALPVVTEIPTKVKPIGTSFEDEKTGFSLQRYLPKELIWVVNKSEKTDDYLRGGSQPIRQRVYRFQKRLPNKMNKSILAWFKKNGIKAVEDDMTDRSPKASYTFMNYNPERGSKNGDFVLLYQRGKTKQTLNTVSVTFIINGDLSDQSKKQSKPVGTPIPKKLSIPKKKTQRRAADILSDNWMFGEKLKGIYLAK